MESSTNSAHQPSDLSKEVIIDDILKQGYADAMLVAKVNERPGVDCAADTESINSEKPIVASSTRSMSSRGQLMARWLRSRLSDRCIYGLTWFAFGLIGCEIGFLNIFFR
uniref:CUE domain-containing protein n=1 Tax=Ascaris lumbricoides TaxID=6252 RepID=A0A0M3HN20_ASCLU